MVLDRNPYTPAKLWLMRSKRAWLERSDQADRVISLQTSMEIFVYATWQMILIDLGRSSTDIDAALDSDTPYKSVINRVLPDYLGGNWDMTTTGRPVGRYWKNLYLVRNRVAHGGYEPPYLEGDEAQDSYYAFRDFLNERIWSQRKKYPRTMAARLGDPHHYGWHNRWADDTIKALRAEPAPFWLPYDIANRPAQAPTVSAPPETAAKKKTAVEKTAAKEVGATKVQTRKRTSKKKKK